MPDNHFLTTAIVLLSLIAAVSAQNSTNTTCGFIGDDNTYGFGIRLGLYIQWITSSIAYNFVPEEAPGQRIVNTCFQLANFAGLLFITFTNGSAQPSGNLYAVEAYIVLMFCLCGVFTGKPYSSTDTSQSQNFALHKASAIGGIIQMVIGAALVYYAIWYVYIGMDLMYHPPCSQYAFLFVKVVSGHFGLTTTVAHRDVQNLYHWFRTLLKVAVTISAVGVTIMILIFVVALFCCVKELPVVDTLKWILTFHIDELSQNQQEEASEEKPRIRLSNISVSLSMVFFILSTELVIRWNHIQGVDTMGSTGQILPIVTAVGSFVTVAWQLVLKLMRGEFGV
jgi:hypothetical protein